MCRGNRTSVGFSPTSVLANALLATQDPAGPGVRDVMMPSHTLAIHSHLPQHPSLSSTPRQVTLYACTMSSSRHTPPLPHCPSSQNIPHLCVYLLRRPSRTANRGAVFIARGTYARQERGNDGDDDMTEMTSRRHDRDDPPRYRKVRHPLRCPLHPSHMRYAVIATPPHECAYTSIDVNAASVRLLDDQKPAGHVLTN